MYNAKIVQLMGGANVLKCTVHSILDMAEVIETGFSAEAVTNIQKYIDASDVDMAKLLGVSPKTYRSRKMFKGDEADHAYQVAKIAVIAENVIGSRRAALEWLRCRQTTLGERIPMELIVNSAGVHAVETVLSRM